jgi:hypothetical protein
MIRERALPCSSRIWLRGRFDEPALSAEVSGSAPGSPGGDSGAQELRSSSTPGVGLEPTTYRLTAGYSAIELPRTAVSIYVYLKSIPQLDWSPCLDFSMAIRAQKNALARLGTQGVQG